MKFMLSVKYLYEIELHAYISSTVMNNTLCIKYLKIIQFCLLDFVNMNGKVSA